jgi:ABC-type phosphate transport system permease subunit
MAIKITGTTSSKSCWSNRCFSSRYPHPKRIRFGYSSTLIFGREGFDFLTGRNGTPSKDANLRRFALHPGTLVTSALHCSSCTLKFGIAIFLVEMAPKTVRVPISYLVECWRRFPASFLALGLVCFAVLGSELY